jgi:four helix bundle protein
VGAQYREATRAKSNADFISKIEGSLQELEETEYWLELLVEAGALKKPEQRQARNGRVERDICEHRKKHQSKV